MPNYVQGVFNELSYGKPHHIPYSLSNGCAKRSPIDLTVVKPHDRVAHAKPKLSQPKQVTNYFTIKKPVIYAHSEAHGWPIHFSVRLP
jgi:hypothetical protein